MSKKTKTTKTTKRHGKLTRITTIITEEIDGKTEAPVAQTASPIPPPAPAPTTQLTNEVIFVLDDSGSMSHCYKEAVKRLNENLDRVREQARTTGQRTLVSVYIFSNTSRRIYNRVPVEIAGHISENDYYGGMTALADAMVYAIRDGLAATDANDSNKSYLLVVITDGGENQSSRQSVYDLPGLIQQVQGTDRWTIACLVPQGYKNAMVRLGVHEGNVTEWTNTVEGARVAFATNAMASNAFYGARAAGHKSVKNYFTMDLGSFNAADLSKMTDLSGSFKTWTVDKESEIQAFVEGKGYRFFIGAGYYPLTKKELLRPGRNVLVVKQNSNGPIYGGKQARQILGIPDGEVHVTPGNHAGWDIYFQSTSRNRHLVRGTRLFYDLTKLADDGETWDSAAAKAAAEAKKAGQATV